MKNVVIGQSGGPASVINSSAAGVYAGEKGMTGMMITPDRISGEPAPIFVNGLPRHLVMKELLEF